MEPRDRFSRGVYISNYRRHLIDTSRMLCRPLHNQPGQQRHPTSDTLFPIALILTIFGSRHTRVFQSREACEHSYPFSGLWLDKKFISPGLGAERWAGGWIGTYDEHLLSNVKGGLDCPALRRYTKPEGKCHPTPHIACNTR